MPSIGAAQRSSRRRRQRPASAGLGVDLLGASSQPVRLGPRRGHGREPLQLADPPGQLERLVERPPRVRVAAPGPQEPEDDQRHDPARRRHVRPLDDASSAMSAAASQWPWVEQRPGLPAAHVDVPGVEVVLPAVGDPVVQGRGRPARGRGAAGRSTRGSCRPGRRAPPSRPRATGARLRSSFSTPARSPASSSSVPMLFSAWATIAPSPSVSASSMARSPQRLVSAQVAGQHLQLRQVAVGHRQLPARRQRLEQLDREPSRLPGGLAVAGEPLQARQPALVVALAQAVATGPVLRERGRRASTASSRSRREVALVGAAVEQVGARAAESSPPAKRSARAYWAAASRWARSAAARSPAAGGVPQHGRRGRRRPRRGGPGGRGRRRRRRAPPGPCGAARSGGPAAAPPRRPRGRSRGGSGRRRARRPARPRRRQRSSSATASPATGSSSDSSAPLAAGSRPRRAAPRARGSSRAARARTASRTVSGTNEPPDGEHLGDEERVAAGQPVQPPGVDVAARRARRRPSRDSGGERDPVDGLGAAARRARPAADASGRARRRGRSRAPARRRPRRAGPAGGRRRAWPRRPSAGPRAAAPRSRRGAGCGAAPRPPSPGAAAGRPRRRRARRRARRRRRGTGRAGAACAARRRPRRPSAASGWAATNARTRTDLPIPASPATSTIRPPAPARTAARWSSMAAACAARSRSSSVPGMGALSTNSAGTPRDERAPGRRPLHPRPPGARPAGAGRGRRAADGRWRRCSCSTTDWSAPRRTGSRSCSTRCTTCGASLRERGADLAVRRGDPVEETLRLAHELGADAVHASSDVSAFAQAREERLARACADARVELQTRPSTTAVAPGALTPAGGDCYRVFTPYYRRWSQVRLGLARTPRRLTPVPGLKPGRIPALRTLSERAPSPELPKGGETAGREQLTRWLSNGLADYGERGELLVPGASSRLEPVPAPRLPLGGRGRAAGPGARGRRAVRAAALLARLLPPAPGREPADPPPGPPPARRPLVTQRAGLRALARRTHRLPDRRRGDAPAAARGLDAEPGPAGRRLVPHQDPVRGLAQGRAPLLRPAGRRGRGQQRRQLAVGRGHRRRHPAEPGAEPRAAGEALRPARGLRAHATCRSWRTSRAPRCTSRGSSTRGPTTPSASSTTPRRPSASARAAANRTARAGSAAGRVPGAPACARRARRTRSARRRRSAASARAARQPPAAGPRRSARGSRPSRAAPRGCSVTRRSTPAVISSISSW